ncbi:MAG: hypothetical protein KAW47_11325 [Thermoplasmatales archaeon]|nr:hypothetical protein [Thermoplasmatales archaeon]
MLASLIKMICIQYLPLKNEFLDAVEKKREPLVSGDDGVYALEIVDAALKDEEESPFFWMFDNCII